MSNDLARTLVTLGAGLATVVVLMGCTLGWAVRSRRLSVFDTAWGLGLGLVALVSFLLAGDAASPAARWALLLTTGLWGVRLSWHVATRNASLPEDPRYVAIVESGSGSYLSIAFRKVFVFQAAGMWLAALPVMVGVNNARLPPALAAAGLCVWAVGVFFEAVGDAQLARFKADPGHRGQVMDRGLWRYTRHPNYFGDACVWWGIWLLAAPSWAGLATVVAPATMTYFLVARTGKAMLETNLRRSKPGYAAYVARTSGFVPWPPRDPTG
ncbi:MAG: DUF1295 domain-containing protein [Nocardioidaceae bacterium]